LALICAVGAGACAARDEYDLDADALAQEAGFAGGVKATVEISYRRPGDSLEFASVYKYSAAEVLTIEPRDSGRTLATVRFEGGVPVWELRASPGVATRVTSLVGLGGQRIEQLRYGEVPNGFAQISPGSGAPEPLARGAYYVFEVQRSSGSTSYQAVKVRADGTLEAYNAQPRAGSSFVLCCNLSPDFTDIRAGRIN
jgi:hypothetical protein